MIHRWLFVMLIATQMLGATAAPKPGGRAPVTVELFSTRSVKTLTLTPLGSGSARQVEWAHDGLRLSPGTTVKHLALSGGFRMQAKCAQEILAAGRWTIAWRPGWPARAADAAQRRLRHRSAQRRGPRRMSRGLAQGQWPSACASFALENANRHGAEGFGLCDSTHCQALRLGRRAPRWSARAGNSRRGRCGSAAGGAQVYYTQHCGGMSESARSVWPAGAGQLPGRATCQIPTACAGVPRRSGARPDCARSAQWDLSPPRVGRRPHRFESIRVDRTERGRPRRAARQVTGQGCDGHALIQQFSFRGRPALGWNQSAQRLVHNQRLGQTPLEIHGRGYGHGVGLCQAGAMRWRAEGHSDAEILSFTSPAPSPAVAAADHGWQRVTGAGWTLVDHGPKAPRVAGPRGNATPGLRRSRCFPPCEFRTVPRCRSCLTQSYSARRRTRPAGCWLRRAATQLLRCNPPRYGKKNGGARTLFAA